MESCVPLADRSVYPADQYPAAQWDYQLFYRENFAAAQAAFEAVVLASISRVRPVCMAAITTILGMVPLLFDAFFESMAVVIMFGLGFATVLTLIVIPVLYTLAYGIKPGKDQHV